MARCPPPTPTRGTPGPRVPVPAPYLGAGGGAEPSGTVTGASRTATAEQGQPLRHRASTLGQLDTGLVPGRNPSHGPAMSPTGSAVPARQCSGGERRGCGVCTVSGHGVGGTVGCKDQRARVMLRVMSSSFGWSWAAQGFFEATHVPVGVSRHCPALLRTGSHSIPVSQGCVLTVNGLRGRELAERDSPGSALGMPVWAASPAGHRARAVL